jgi:hypothetical protein
MTKLTFKRLALVVVASLGFGVLSTGASSGVMVASSDTLTLSATTSAISAGETASVTVTQTVIAAAEGDSIGVRVTDQSSPDSGDGLLAFYVTDSSNAIIRTTAQSVPLTTATGGSGQKDYYGIAGQAYGTDINAFAGGTTALSATYRLSFMAPTKVGTYVFRVYAVQGSSSTGTYSPVAAPLTWTVTVSANASSVGTTASKFYLNRLAEYNAFNLNVDASTNTYKGIESDSALVVSAGAVRTAANYTAVGVIYPVIMNSSDTKVATATSGRVQESLTVTIGGAGQLAGHSRYSGQSTVYSKQVTIAYNESVVVFSDGSVGTSTITGYVGGTSASANALTQGTKSITFVGRATTFTVSGLTAAQRGGSAVPYRTTADSATSSATGNLGAGLLPAIRFVATDAAGNAVTTAALSTDKGDATTNFYAISSDTSIVASGVVSATNTFATNTARRNAALTCDYDSVTAYWYCTGRVFDSGTVTLTIVDSRTITANSNSTTATTDAVNKSAAFSVTFAGAGNTGTIAFDKTTYNVNEKATLTLTAKDGMERTVADGAYPSLFTSLSWKGAIPSFGNDASTNAEGGRFTVLLDYLASGTTFVGGIDTAMVFMPATAGTYTLVGKTGTETVTKDLLTITVVDPAAAATLAAAEAATDAAAEAIDAANAATDAANLAAEAADAATVAAEEARDAADAATAAVEELATQVATLMAALKAQITTLANTVAKIAKKVKA